MREYFNMSEDNIFFVSVIVPVYQVEAYIENCMKSLVSQTFKNFEIILVNDGTKDNSISIAKKILDKAPVAYSVIHQENSGLSAARNAGIRAARGDYIIAVDSDDCIHPNMIEHLYNVCQQNSTNVCFSDFVGMANSKNILDWSFSLYETKVFERAEILKVFLLRQPAIHASTILVNKDFLFENSLLFDDEAPYCEDSIFIWKLLFLIDKISYVNAPYYHYLVRPMSIMTSSNNAKVVAGYERIKVMLTEIKGNDESISHFIVARWVLGALRAASRRSSYASFNELAKQLNCKNHMSILKLFPDRKVRFLARCLKFSTFIYFFFMKSIDSILLLKLK